MRVTRFLATALGVAALAGAALALGQVSASSRPHQALHHPLGAAHSAG